jgi:hypothetical protein
MFVLASIQSFGQEVRLENFEKKYPSDSLKIWTHNTLKDVIENHPGMYRYTSKSVFDAYTEQLIHSITDSLTTIGYYRKLKPLFAKIGCLHTSITLTESYKAYYENAFKFIPIGVFVDGEKVFVTESYGTHNDIPIKSEITHINKQPISEILKSLYNAIPSDGYNKTLKTLTLNHSFPLWYQSILGSPKQFEIVISKDNQNFTYYLEGISKDELPAFKLYEDEKKLPLTFKLDTSVAVLTIATFSNSTIVSKKQKYKKFIKRTFQKLKTEETENLIIDLRNNTGGSDGNAAYLASFFFEKPFKYWENQVEITEPMALSFKTWYGIFYKMPKKVDTVYRWKGMHSWLSKAFSYYKTQKPAKQNYKGNVYILTNGGCMSSCADLVAILSHNKKAIVVGEESGGGFQGNTSGMMPTMNIRPNLTMTIPLQKYTNAVDPTKNVGRGTIPDYPLPLTLDDWIHKIDTQIEYVKQLIKKQ